MLRWTAGGAVPAPTTVQIRVHPQHPDRIPVGAPAASRRLTDDELAANLSWFTVGLDTPRSRACDCVVLSGQGVLQRNAVPDMLRRSRQHGVQRIVVHAAMVDLDGLQPLRWADAVDTVVLPLQPGPSLARATRARRRALTAGLRVTSTTVLDAAAVGQLDQVCAVLADSTPGTRHTFTYPFPTGPRARAQAPAVADAVQALIDALPRLPDTVSPAIKGLPACFLGQARHLLSRTANRWYVDAEHQTQQALLFFPDVVAFHKAESCRFCAAADHCDGFFAAYLDPPGAPQLTPLESA